MARRGAPLGTSVLDLDIDDSRFHSKMSGAYKAAQGFTDQAGKSLVNAGRKISGFGEGWTRNVTAPIVAAGGIVTKFGLDFDRTLSQVVALTSVTQDQIGGIRSELIKLAPEVGKGPQELAEAFYFVASAGFEGAEALEVTKNAAKAAAAGLGDTATVAKVVGTAINAYGRENITAAEATDTLVAAIGEGSAEAPEFAGALGNVIGSAAQIGASFPDVTAAIAAMTNVGIGAEEAVTSLNQVFVSLFKPTAEAAEALDGMGLSAASLRTMIAEQGLLPTLQLLSEKFEGNAEATAQVFGNVRALRGVLALTGGDADKTAGIFERMQDTVGATGEAFKTIAESDAFKFDRALAKLETTATELGQDVLPIVVEIIDDVADALGAAADAFNDLDPSTRKTIIQALAFIAVAGPMIVIVGKLTTGIGQVFKAIAFLTGAKGIPALVTWLKRIGPAATSALGPLALMFGLFEGGKQLSRELFPDNMFDQFADFQQISQRTGKSLDQLGDDWQSSGLSAHEFVVAIIDALDAGKSYEDALADMGQSSKEFSGTVEEAAESFDENMLRYATAARDGTDAVGDALAALPPEVQAQLEAAGIVVDESAPKTFDGMVEAARAAAKSTPEAIIGEFVAGKIDVETAANELAALIPAPLRAAALEALGIVRALPGDIAQSIIDGRDEVVTAATGLGDAATDPLVNQARIDETRAQMQEIIDAVAEGGGAWTAQQQADYAKAEIMLAGYLLRADPKSKEAMGLLAKYADSEDPATQEAYENLVSAIEDRALVLEENVEERAAATSESLPDALARTKADVEREAYLHFLSTIPPAQRMKDDVNDLSSETARATREALDAEKVRTGIAAESVALRVRSPLAHLKDDAYWWGRNVTSSIASGLEDPVAIAWLNKAAANVASITARKLTINSEPPDHSSALYGITKWGGNIVKTVASDILNHLGIAEGAGDALAGALVPRMAALAMPSLPSLGAIGAVGSMSNTGTADRLGSVTNIYQLHVDGKPIVVGTPNDVLDEWQRMATYSDYTAAVQG